MMTNFLCIRLGMSTEPTYQRLYVGSLHFSLTDEDVRQIFEPFGPLDFVNLHKGMIE
jgi:RNA-binding protein 39